MQPSAADQANEQLVDRMIAEGAPWSPALIAAFRATPRHCFVDRVLQYQRKPDGWRETVTRDPGPEELRIIYSDRALITHVSPRNQESPEAPISSSSQPSLMAQMLEDLRLHPGMRVLEVGAGTGYNAALMARMVGPDRVISIDVDREVLSEAWAHLRCFTERRVQLAHADGRLGFPEQAPYQRIMVTAATPDLEPAWLEQLADGGLLLAPLALAPGLAFVVRGTVRDRVFAGQLTRAAYFMPLRAEDEAGSSDLDVPQQPTQLRSLPAPWAGWFDRKRPRLNMLGFMQSLAFFGWLKGLTVHYRTLTNGLSEYGVSEPGSAELVRNSFCWLGMHDWQVGGDAGRDLGHSLWRAFLDAGGPWPTEFRMQASVDAGLPNGTSSVCFFRQGPRTRQLWELVGERDRPTWI